MADGVEIRRISKMERIAALDVLRGLAILAILVMNVPTMGGYGSMDLWDPRLISWTAADQATFRFVGTFLAGTQRGLLELLFGAGIMIMARAGMRSDSPIAVADLNSRRNLWLCALGVFQALVLMWPGDILLAYGLTAIFVFPFRRLAPKWKAILGAAAILVAIAPSAMQYPERLAQRDAAHVAQAKVEAGRPLAAAERKALEAWREKAAQVAAPAAQPKVREAMAQERAARLGSPVAYWTFLEKIWVAFNFTPFAWFSFAEIFGTMLLGAALYEWGVIQGRAGAATYIAMIVGGYGIGVTLRTLAMDEYLTFSPDPKPFFWFGWDIARIALCLGHLGLVNLLLKAAAGRVLLAPFEATGKMPLTTYLGASMLCMLVIFPGFGLGQWGRHGWAGLEGIALLVMAGQLVFANVWLTVFETGPLEWVWKSLAYGRRQPFRKVTGAAGALAAAE